MAEARSVGLVCFLQEEKEWNAIKPAMKPFQALGAQVYVLAIYPAKVKPLWYVETMNTLMCSECEFGISGIPKGQKVKEFLKQRFDILIDCDLSEHYSTMFLSTLSLAGFKVGLDTEKNRRHFDLLINMQESNTETFVEQVLFYLSVFKTGKQG